VLQENHGVELALLKIFVNSNKKRQIKFSSRQLGIFQKL
jgi:hypothetical protein